MVKFKRSVSMLLVGLLVSTALAGAVKIKEFDFTVGPLARSGADGMAILNYIGSNDETVVQIVLTGVLADTYLIALADNPDDPPAGAACEVLWQVTVDSNGATTLHDTVAGDVSGRGFIIGKGDICANEGRIRIAVGRQP